MTYIHSHFGVYGVAVKDNEMLVIKKARGPYLGLYDLPGGSPEALELLEEVLVREVKEETALDVVESEQIGAFSTLYDYTKEGTMAKLRHIGVLYNMEVEGTPSKRSDGLDSHGCEWVDIDDLNSNNASPFVNMAKETIHD